MKKLFFLTALLCASMMSWGIDWNAYDYLGDGAGEGAYSNKYKVAAAFGQTVVNIQPSLNGGIASIYTYFSAAITDCSLETDQYALNGAGIYLYLSAFSAKETAVTVTAGGLDYAFTVFYADGTGEVTPGGDDDDEHGQGDLTPATYYGQSTQPVSGTDVVFDWSITRNADSTLTFAMSWDKEIQGVVPQVNINDVYTTMPCVGREAHFTTSATYTDGEELTIFFLVAYTGNAARIDLTYTVGSSNEKPEGVENTFIKGTHTSKVIENGTLYFIKDGVRFNVLGTEVR